MRENPYASPTPFGDSANYGTPGKTVSPVAGMVPGILHLMYAALPHWWRVVLSLIYPVVVIISMYRPKMIAAYRGS